MTAALRVGGVTPLTTIDFPGRLAAVVFLQGCPWRCGYCQNPALLPADASGAMSWADVTGFLERRRGLLDGVVFSGGEPTLQAALPAAVADVRERGFEAGLHTAGIYPERLAALLPSLQWVGLDVKAPWDDYEALTGVPGSAAKVRASLARVLESGVEHECRTTWHPGLYGLERLHALADALADVGVRRWVVQACRREGQPLPVPPVDELLRLGARFDTFSLR